MGSIDVVIPNYNYGHFLRECVESVRREDLADLRIIIIDNASKDDSLAVARALAAEDPRIEVVEHTVNIGMHGSFNEGIDRAAADYMILLHADDLTAPGALRRAVDFMDAHPNVVMTIGPAIDLGDPMRPGRTGRWTIESGDRFIENRCRTAQNIVACATVVVRTAAQKAAGHWDPTLSFAPDLEMWLRIARQGDIGQTTAVQGIVRKHEDNLSAYTRERLAPELEAVELAFECFFAKEEAAGRDVSDLRAMVAKSLADRAYWAALAHFARGSREGARELATMASSRRHGSIMPPFGYIFRRSDGIRRIGEVIRASVAGRMVMGD